MCIHTLMYWCEHGKDVERQVSATDAKPDTDVKARGIKQGTCRKASAPDGKPGHVMERQGA